MSDIYAAPTADVTRQVGGERTGGNIEDAIEGNIEIDFMSTMNEAWDSLKGFKTHCLFAWLIYIVAAIVVGMLSLPVVAAFLSLGIDETTAEILDYFVQTMLGALTYPMMAGITIMGIRHACGKPVTASSIFAYFHRIPGILLWIVLWYLLVSLGLALFVLPGIYLIFAYSFSLVLMIEKDISAWQALEISRKAVTRLWFRTTGFMLLCTFLIILGLLLLVIPLIWILPWLSLAYALIYLKLFGAEAATLAD